MRRKEYGNPFANFIRVFFSRRPWRATRELVRFRFQRGPSWQREPGWKFQITLGRGAGYRVGRTLYVARHCVGARMFADMHRRIPWQIGFTRNGNRVPWLSY